MLLAAKDIFCIQRYEIFHEIPNSGGDFSTNGPEKGFRGRVAALRGRFPGPQPGEGQRVQRRGTGTGRGFCGGAGAGPARSAARDRAVQVVLRWSPEAEPACSAARDRGGTGSSEVQTGRAGRRVAKKVFRREDAPAARTQKKCSEGKVRRRPNTYGHKKNGPRSVHFYFCYSTGFCSGMLVRYTLPHDNGSALREPVSFAGDFRQHVLLQQPVCLRFRSARRSGVTAVKASAIRSLSRSAARRSGLSRLAAGISAVRVAPRESLRPPPGVTVLSRRGHSSQPSGVSAVRSPELAVPAARPLRRRGHSTTTSVWPSTCNWRISCVELT